MAALRADFREARRAAVHYLPRAAAELLALALFVAGLAAVASVIAGAA